MYTCEIHVYQVINCSLRTLQAHKKTCQKIAANSSDLNTCVLDNPDQEGLSDDKRCR